MKPETIGIIAIIAPLIAGLFAAFVRFIRSDAERAEQLRTLIEGQDEIKNLVAGQATDLGLLRSKVGEIDNRSQKTEVRVDGMEKQFEAVAKQITHMSDQIDKIEGRGRRGGGGGA